MPEETGPEEEEEARLAFMYAVSNILSAIDSNRPGEAARWLVELIYCAGGFEEQYLSLFRKIVSLVATTKPGRFARQFAESLDRGLERVMAREGPRLASLADRAREIKEEMLGHYMVPPKELIERARSLVDEVFGR